MINALALPLTRGGLASRVKLKQETLNRVMYRVDKIIKLLLCGLLALLPAAVYAQGGGAKPDALKVNTAGKSPAQLIGEAKADIEKFKTGTADQLLQAVTIHPDASTAQLEEALVLQLVLYYGDVIGAMTVIPSLGKVAKEGSALKGAVGKQLVLARRAFAASMSSYLNSTITGTQLKQTNLPLPGFSEADARRIHQTLAETKTLDAIVSNFASDPAPGMGLLSRANLLGLYVSAGSLSPRSGGFAALRSKLGGGVEYKADRYLDWAATAALEMHGMVNDPGGPDMLALSRRCDERLLQWYGKDANNSHVKAAKQRLGR